MTQTVIQLFGRGALPPGTRLNDIYEIESTIGVGGMGEIYKGRQIETGDPVAIKMIKPELAGNEAVLALFRKEASALHYLYHDAIVRYFVFSIDRALNRHYLAMEFVDGQPLSDHLKKAPLTYEQVNQLRLRVAPGLQAAHDKGVIHRDISPDNIILQGGDIRRAKIIDFGIARTSSLGHATVIGDGFAGKYNYVSPEQLGMFGGDVTNRSDIYSFGLVLAEALLGRPIDMSGSQADVIQKRQGIPDLSSIDPRLRPLIAKMLQPRPEDRPASMAEVAAWVEDKARTRAAGGGRLGLIAAGVAGVAALGAVGGWLLLRAPKTDPVVNPVTQPTTQQQAGQSASPSTSGQTTSPIGPVASLPQTPAVQIDPDPPKLPNLTASERAQRIAQYVRYFNGGPCLLLAPTAVTERAASIEAFGLSDQMVQTFDTDFRLVNGFAPLISMARLSSAQCPAVTFIQRVDPERDPALKLDFRQPSVRREQRAQAAIEGVGDRQAELIVVGDTGRVRSLTSQLKRDRGTTSFDGRIDDDDNSAPGSKLALLIVSQKPLESLANVGRTTAWDLFPNILDELQRTNQQVQIVPKLVRIER